ncbi:MAG: hypothetical protein ACLPOO_08235 [Terriglobales bacterium]
MILKTTITRSSLRLASLSFVLCLTTSLCAAQSLKSFEGIDATTDPTPGFTVDPNGAVGTKQYLEWVDQAYQGYDKTTFAPVYPSAQKGNTPWVQNDMPDCETPGGNGIILFDHLASRWIIAVRVGTPSGYFYCIAISSTDDLTATSFEWYTYELSLNPIITINGTLYYPDYPKIATWPDAYYATFDLENTSKGFQNVGILACAFDRTNMLINGTVRTPQCFVYPQAPSGLFLGHSLLPADIDGTTPPPTGTVESFVSIENPSGTNTTSAQLNLWQMHVDWTTPTNSTFTGPTPIAVNSYTPGCYNLKFPTNTYCVPEPSSPTTKNYIDSVGDRLMHRFAFRQFPTYQSYIVTQTVQPGATQQTGIRWYEFSPFGSTLSVTNSGTISPDTMYFRFMPSAAQDKVGNLAVGYSGSSTGLHPSIGASHLNLPSNTRATEFRILMGTADAENSSHWGGYTSMTVDPVDDCTFWYVNEYLTTNQTGQSHSWRTRIAKFKLSTCE